MYKIVLRDHENLIIDKKTYLYGMHSRRMKKDKIQEFMIDNEVFWAGYGYNTVVSKEKEG